MEWIFSESSPARKPLFDRVKLYPFFFGVIALVGWSSAWAQPVGQTSIAQNSTKSLCTDEQRNDRDLEQVQAVAFKDTLLHVIEEREDHLLRWSCYGAQSMRSVRTTLIKSTQENDALVHFYVHDNLLTTISARRNRESDREEIYVARYDQDGKLLFPEKLVHSKNEWSDPRRNEFQCKFSPDSTRILIFFDSAKERKQTEAISFKCYSSDWSLLWEKELRLPPSADVLQPHHFLVDNDGGVYMMSGRKPLKAASDWQHPQGGKYVVYFYNAAQNKLKQYDINLKDKQVVSVDFAFNRKQELIIAGYYSDNFQNRASGTLLFCIEASGGRIQKASYTPFAKEFLKEMTGKEKGTLDDFYLDYLMLTDSGDVVLAGENYYMSRIVSTDPTTGRQLIEYRYNYDEIMVCRMDTAATHLWNVRIPKKQFTSLLNDENFSYSCVLKGESVTVTFNDDDSNNELNKSGKQASASPWSGSKNSVTTRVDINLDGQYRRFTLVDNSQERLLYNPLMCPPTSWSQPFLGFNDKRSYKFCRTR
jgi:hypothetical protein